MIEITSADDPRIAPFTHMRATRPWQKDDVLPITADAELVVAEGEKVVRSLLASSLQVVAVLAETAYYDSEFSELLSERGVSDDRRYIAARAVLKDVVGYRMHQGIMAIGIAPAQKAAAAMQGPVVVLNRLANAENVGAIVRNCAAFGVKNLIIDSDCASPFARRSVKVAMGTAFGLNWHRAECLSGVLKHFSQRGVAVVAAAIGDAAQPLPDYRFPSAYALVLGSEGHGLDEVVMAECSDVVCIPMAAGVDSLNVAAASAVFLYHASVSG